MEWMILPFKKYAQFTGRARRKEYWMFMLLYVICLVVAGTIDGIIFGRPMAFYFLVILAFFVPMIAVGVRRMHDTDHSGWFIIIPVVNLVFSVTEGSRGPNRFGGDPKLPGHADVFA